MKKVKFAHNDLPRNSNRLARHFGLERVEDVPVLSYTISNYGKAGKVTFQKKANWESVALLMLYLVEGRGDEIFHITQSKKEDVIWRYLGRDICEDALKNPETPFDGIHHLLQKGARLSVSLEPHH